MAGYDYTAEEEGKAEPIVHPECYSIIHRYTGGVPRLINALLDTALITAFVEQDKCISIKTLELSVDELQWIPYVERVGIKHFADKNVASLNMAGEPTPKLVMMDGDKPVACFDITKEVTTIGRIPSNDIHIGIKSVSMHHAKVISFHKNFFLEDLRSTNGTLVNGHRINKCVLKAGDKISFANVTLEYRVDNISYQDKHEGSAADSSKPNKIKNKTSEMSKNMLGSRASEAAIPA